MNRTVEVLFFHIPAGRHEWWAGWYNTMSGLTHEAMKRKPLRTAYADDMLKISDNVAKVYFTYNEYNDEYRSHKTTYTERRLTPEDEKEILHQLVTYWEIPF